MNGGLYYIGKYRTDFGVLISPEAIAEFERMAAAENLVLGSFTPYDLIRGFHGSYCLCEVKRHPDGTFAVTELCQGHLDELQDEADERARALLGE